MIEFANPNFVCLECQQAVRGWQSREGIHWRAFGGAM